MSTIPKPEPDAKRVAAARRRRDAGERPLVWDNELLRVCDERTNPAPAVAPTIPEPGSESARALGALFGGAATVSEMARRLGVGEARVRTLLDGLRSDGWWIECAGGSRFYLVAHQIAA
ncbi:MAG: hypothetical protein R3B57_08160 [Phycisphaerales bacterium]